MPKIVPKSVQTCFEDVLGWFFGKFFAQCSMEGRVFGNLKKKNQKIFKVPKMPKIVPKSVQTKIFKKNQKVSKLQKCPKSSPKESKRVSKMF